MQLVDATYYKNDFKGSCIPVNAFDYYYKKSMSRLNYYTFNRLKDIDMSNYQFSNDIKNCICEISELLFKQDTLKINVMNNKIIQSVTVGKHSVTYNTSSIGKEILSNDELEARCYEMCKINLLHTHLLYRGA